MRTKWKILSLVMGLLIFAVGGVLEIIVVEFFGSIVMLPAIAEICDKIFPEKKKVRETI